jgi:hypothetical protein
MRCRLLAFAFGASALMSTSAQAEASRGALRVSATVVRPCRVTTDTPSVRVDCGSRPQPVQISQSTPTPTPQSQADSHATPSVTIEF